MKEKRVFWIVIALISMSALVLSGCGVIPGLIAGPPVSTPSVDDDQPGLPPVVGPEAARDAVLDYLRVKYASAAPAEGFVWAVVDETPEGLVGTSIYKYVTAGWQVIVTYPVVAPDATIYTVKVYGDAQGFSWEGLVDAYGQVAEVRVFIDDEDGDSQPTETPLPTSTPTPTLEPTQTPLPTRTPLPTPTPKPLPCNAAQFISDVTVKDGTVFATGAEFTKTWRLKNAGTCTWTTEYDLVFADGDRMDGKKAVALPEKVEPGETVEVSVKLTAPEKADDYRSYWMLRSDGGEWFGLGEDADKAFWVDITTVKPSGDYEYDFALNFCAATWRSEQRRLPCPGSTTDEDGFVSLLETPALENRPENELALWVHPNEVRYGWIEGTYPFFEVDDGDHFKAWVGCLEGSDRCNLTFYLAYETESGKVYTLGEWTEIYDEEVTKIDVDLSELADESVRIILGMEVNNKKVEDAHGFWFVPRIENED